ncbi:MAG TPA: hypothetical protein VGD13_15865 [Xanthobacteraceae bacterium]|jgi:hypothetical protein
MRKLTAIIAALGFLGATSLTPVLAASPTDNGSVEFSAQKKAKKAKRVKVKTAKKRTADLQISQDLSAQKKAKRAKAKRPRAKAKAAEVQTIGDLSAQKKNAKRAKAKKPGSKAKAKSAAIYYRIAA